MGKKARIAELEAELEHERRGRRLIWRVKGFIKDCAELPEDAVLLYTLTGQRVSHQIGLSARRLLEAIEQQEKGRDGSDRTSCVDRE